MKYTVHTDGGARGNPGPAAAGVVIQTGDKTVHEAGVFIGHATNNVAEYTAIHLAYTWLLEHAANDTIQVEFFLDSLLVVNQLNGIFKIKNPDLRDLLFKIKIQESSIGGVVSYRHIPREENTRADYWVNLALDKAAHVVS